MKTKLLFLLLTLFTASLFASSLIQEDENPTGFFASIATLLVIVPIVTEWAKTKLGLEGLGVQILSWSLGVLIAFAGFFLNLGMFADMTWLGTLATGVGLSLISNGIADTGIVTWLLSFIPKKS